MRPKLAIGDASRRTARSRGTRMSRGRSPSESSCREDKPTGCLRGRSARSRVHGRLLRRIAIPQPIRARRSLAIGQFPQSPPGNFPIPEVFTAIPGSFHRRSPGVVRGCRELHAGKTFPAQFTDSPPVGHGREGPEPPFTTNRAMVGVLHRAYPLARPGWAGRVAGRPDPPTAARQPGVAERGAPVCGREAEDGGGSVSIGISTGEDIHSSTAGPGGGGE